MFPSVRHSRPQKGHSECIRQSGGHQIFQDHCWVLCEECSPRGVAAQVGCFGGELGALLQEVFRRHIRLPARLAVGGVVVAPVRVQEGVSSCVQDSHLTRAFTRRRGRSCEWRSCTFVFALTSVFWHAYALSSPKWLGAYWKSTRTSLLVSVYRTPYVVQRVLDCLLRSSLQGADGGLAVCEYRHSRMFGGAVRKVGECLTNGRLLGLVGHTSPARPLAEDVYHVVVSVHCASRPADVRVGQ